MTKFLIVSFSFKAYFKIIIFKETVGSRQETFLPLVHQIWSSLRLLFKSNNIFVVDKAFDCLLVIGQHARDFVHKRVVTDVVPAIVKFFATLDILVKVK